MVLFRKVLVLVSLLLGGACYAFAQQGKDSLTLRVMSYNVENLFDYEHDNLKDDSEFLPDADRRWNRKKYKRKLNAIASVITAVGGNSVHSSYTTFKGRPPYTRHLTCCRTIAKP